MAYDKVLADRLRAVLAHESGLAERRMFGGLAFLVDGHLTVAVSGQGGLMLRADPAEVTSLLAEAHTAPMQMRGRVMTGWLRVVPEGCERDDDLARWAAIGLARARSLPAKP